jgi:hypothetical protein
LEGRRNPDEERSWAEAISSYLKRLLREAEELRRRVEEELRSGKTS